MKTESLNCMGVVSLDPPPTLVPSLFRLIGLSLLLMISLSLLGMLVQRLLFMGGITGISLYLDNFLVGVLAGLLAFVHERRRSREIRRKLALISALNHYAGSTLQAMPRVNQPETAKQMEFLYRTVKCIDSEVSAVIPAAEKTAAIKSLAGWVGW